ncbi:MAG: glycosyltransferase family 2 protein [Wenzhouxiangella sp.]
MPNPLVSIGIPVYNGERFLRQALDSLVDQTYSDFELIISDNASTDGTPEICREYAGRDPRIRYIRQPINIGVARNWNALVHEARGVYFKWAPASDYCAPQMLERCIEAMIADPGVVLCYGKTLLVDEDGEPKELYEYDTSVSEPLPSERFAHVCRRLWLNNIMCGVHRRDVLRRTRLHRIYPSSDKVLMAELALYGRFKLIDEVLLFRRQGPETSTIMGTPLELQRVFEPTAKAPMKFLVARRRLHDFVSISRAPIPTLEKLRAYGVALRMIIGSRRDLWREFLSMFGRGRSTA